MKLSLPAIKSLRFISAYSDEKQIINEKETNAPRFLSNEQSAQRRFFYKNTEEIINKAVEEINEKIIAHNKLVEDKRAAIDGEDKEKDAMLKNDKELNESFNEIKEVEKRQDTEVYVVDVEPKTKKFLKSVFDGWKSWVVTDDAIREEIEISLK